MSVYRGPTRSNYYSYRSINDQLILKISSNLSWEIVSVVPPSGTTMMTRVRFASNDPIRVTKSRLKYGHVFCYQCLVNWSRIIRQCPTCKTKYRGFHDESIISPENGKFDYVFPPPHADSPVFDIR